MTSHFAGTQITCRVIDSARSHRLRYRTVVRVRPDLHPQKSPIGTGSSVSSKRLRDGTSNERPNTMDVSDTWGNTQLEHSTRTKDPGPPIRIEPDTNTNFIFLHTRPGPKVQWIFGLFGPVQWWGPKNPSNPSM